MGIEQVSVALGIAAGVTQLVGYLLYNKGEGARISTGSWSIWAVGGIIDLVSFFSVTKDMVVNILPAVCALAAISTFFYALARKRLTWPDRIDFLFVGIDGVITVVWCFTNAILANLLYQVSTILSFVPMGRDLITEREKGKPLPWLVWTLAYILLAASVALRLKRWEELAYPLCQMTVHFNITLIIIAKQKN